MSREEIYCQCSLSLCSDSLNCYLIAEPQNRKTNLLQDITSCVIVHCPSGRLLCSIFPGVFPVMVSPSILSFISSASSVASPLGWHQRMYGCRDLCKTAAQLSTACPKVEWTKHLLFLKKNMSRRGDLWRIWTGQRHPVQRTELSSRRVSKSTLAVRYFIFPGFVPSSIRKPE